MVTRIDASDARVPVLTETLVRQLAESCYLEFVDVYASMDAEIERPLRWDEQEEEVQIAALAAARVAWKVIALAGGAVRSD